MSFKEIFERYRNNTASDEELALVEEELEKYKLITEYLDEDWDVTPVMLTDEAPLQDMKKIRKNMRKRNALIVTTSIVLCMVIFLTSWLIVIPTMERHYWNPEHNNTGVAYSTDLEAMLAVYAELVTPDTGIGKVTSSKTGFATYDLNIQYWQYKVNGNDRLYTKANIVKGELELPAGFLNTVPVNIFTRGTYPYITENLHYTSSYKLLELPEYVTITAAVSFKEDMSMEELIQFEDSLLDGYINWVGIRNSAVDVQLVPLCGFMPNQSGYVRDELNTTYPCLEIKGLERTADNFEEHFKSMLRFMDDQYNLGTCLELSGKSNDKSYYREVLEYVEANGIYSYGCYVTATPETFAQILSKKFSPVEQIWIQDSALNID